MTDPQPCATIEVEGDPIQHAPLVDASIARYAEDGYVVLRGLLDASTVDPLCADVLSVLRARNLPDSYLAQASEYLAGSAIERLVNSPRLAGLASQLLAGPARLYLPFTAVKGPVQGRFTFHQDNSYTRLDGPACNCWIALSDVTPDNGCLRMVPRSHRDGTLAAAGSQECPGHRQVAEPAAWDDIILRAGDCVVFSRLTVHGSGANGTSAPRLAYAVQFHREDVKAWFDERWELLTVRPRWRVGPVATLSSQAGVER